MEQYSKKGVIKLVGFTVNPYTHCLNCGRPTVNLYNIQGKIVYARNIRDINRSRVPLSHAECSSCHNRYLINFSDGYLIRLLSMEDIQFMFDIPRAIETQSK